MTAAVDRLLACGKTDEGDWIFTFDAEGQPRDSRRDLYTQAFMIFGLVHAGEALGRPELIAAARASRRRLTDHWRAPAGGFLEGELHPGLRRQNPHMHLFEAALALCETAGPADPEDWSLAEELWALFKDRFAASDGVLEYFDDGLQPLKDERGRVCEPGHAFEWSWLADRWSHLIHQPEQPLARAMFAAGLNGLLASGAACDEMWIDGGVRTASARCWPQTEYLKAALRVGLINGATDGLGQVLGACDALEPYLQTGHPGVWRDRRLADGGWAEGPSPASSGYHIVCALHELISTWARTP
jgi:mannose-6-phosphate isomerase